ncbi:MAG: MFS transporter, partial [Chloroflexi bacterium]|nr:MFS transporter [Chloroflexota bacterium]
EMSLTRQEALHTPAFWLLTIMLTVNSVATTGITFHMVPHFTDVGISNAAAAGAVSALTVASMASVFVWGFLADHLGAKRVLLAVLVAMELGAFLVAGATSVPAAYLAAAIFGLGMAGYALLSEVVWATFFGRKHLGSIRGVTMVFQLAGNASGSLIAAFLYDIQGSYDGAFNVILAGFALSTVMLVLARRPKARAAVGQADLP